MRSSAAAESTGSYLLDTSAILAYCLNEPQAGRVASICHRASIPFIAFAELYAAVWLKFGQPEADRVVATIRQWHRPIAWATEETLLLSGRFRVRYQLGLGDSLIAALAHRHHYTLVTKDSDFKPLSSNLKLLFLA